MEEKQKNNQKQEFKGNLGFVWLIGLLVILLGCVTIYTLKITADNKELKQAPVAKQSQTTVTAQEPKAENTNKTTVMTSQDKYNIWVQNAVKEIGKAKENAFFQSVKISNNKTCEVGLTPKGILYFTLENQGSREFDKDVVSFEICDVGNGGYKAAYYIKKDGTVYYVVLDEYQKEDGEIKPTQVKNAKNIVSIINNTYTDEPSWSAEVWLIDIDGNVYKQ